MLRFAKNRSKESSAIANVIILILAVSLSLYACSETPSEPVTEPGTLSGRVFFEDTDRTIPKVVVSVAEQEYKTVTNGKFEFENLPYGTYRIEAEKGGYVSYLGEVTIDAPTVVHNIDLWYEPEE